MLCRGSKGRCLAFTCARDTLALDSLRACSWSVVRGRTRLTLRLRQFDYFLITYIFLNFFTSAVTSPEPRMTLRWAMMNAIVIAPIFCFDC